MENEDKNHTLKRKIKVENKQGLTISYYRKELDEFFPNLAKEVFEKKKSIKIEACDNKFENKLEKAIDKSNESHPNELYNPGAVDFIRRCKSKEEAIKILDYLLKRNEIDNKTYHNYKNIISEEGGLENFINESGGLKQPGYYMRKYYKKSSNDQKLNNSDD